MAAPKEAMYAKYSEHTANDLASFSMDPTRPIPPSLLRVISDTSLHGLTCWDWNHLKELLAARYTQVANERKLRENNGGIDGGFEIQRDDLAQKLKSYDSPPFTLQRICEMVSEQGFKHYKSPDKFLFAFEKLVTVTTSAETISSEQFDRQVVEMSETMTKLLSKPVIYENQGGKIPPSLLNEMPNEAAFFGGGSRPPASSSSPAVDPMIVDS